MSLIPLPYRLLAYALILAALFGAGWYEGHKAGKAAGEADLAAFRASVEIEAAKQAVHAQQVIAQQEKVSADISSDYERKLAALRARGVRIESRPDGSAVPTLSCAPGGADGRSADAVPSVPKADFDDLTERASETTQQLVSLQEWIRQQQAAFP